MAQYTVTHSCGHAETVHLYGRAADRQRRIEYLESLGLCGDCFAARRQQQREQASSEAEKWSADNGLPALDGTERQCTWAESLRREKLTRLAEEIGRTRDLSGFAYWCAVVLDERSSRVSDPEAAALLQSLQESPLDASRWGVFGDWMDDHGQAPAASVLHAVNWLLQQSSAKWWIDNRYRSVREVVCLKAKEPQRLAEEEAARRRQREEEAARRQAEEEKVRKLWEQKDEIARRAKEFLGGLVTEVKVGEWSGTRRCYVGKGYGSTQATYYHTGDGHTRPGTLLLPPSLGAAIGDRLPEFKAWLASLCGQWKAITVRVDEGGTAGRDE